MDRRTKRYIKKLAAVICLCVAVIVLMAHANQPREWKLVNPPVEEEKQIYTLPAELPGEIIEENSKDIKNTEAAAEEWTEIVVRDDITYGTKHLSEDAQMIMQNQCLLYEIPYALAIASAEVESGFEEGAISVTGDIGIMQINSKNAAWLNSLGFDIQTLEGNIGAGLYMMSLHLNKYQDETKALMCYNNGEGKAGELWAQRIYKTPYTEKVLEKYAYWKEFLYEV